VDIRQTGDGEFNIDDLMPGPTDAPPDAESDSGELPAFTVKQIVFSAERLAFSDVTRDPVYATQLSDVGLEIARLSTVREPGSPYQLSIVTEHGGALDWEGDLSLAAKKSSGAFELSAIDLRPAWRYLSPRLQFILESALLDVSGRYAADWTAAPRLQLSQGELALRTLDIRPKDEQALPETAVTLSRLALSGITADTRAKTVELSTVAVDALSVSGFTADDRHSLIPLFAVENDAADTAEATEAKEAPPAATPDDGGWRVSLASFHSDNSRLRWRSAYTTPEVLTLDPLQWQVDNIAWPAETGSDLSVSLTANGESELALDGTLNIGSGDGNIAYRLTSQPLSWFNPLLAQVLRATVDDGALHAEGSVGLQGFAPGEIALDTRVEDFALRIFGRDATVSGWRELRIPDVRVDLPARRAGVGEMTLAGYRGNLHILPDGRLNAQLALPPSADKADEDAGGAWAFRVAGLKLEDARVDFEDESLAIPFRTLIGELEGSVGALDSAQADNATEIALRGSVDGYAPVSIDGRVAPFAAQTSLNVAVRFQGVDIANLTPYSGTYAGYAIDAGTLNLDLGYTLEGDRLQGDNRAVISQMQLGEKIESERAVDLPLRLAIALLTDTRGVIDLEVPIEGDIDNPEFSLGKVIGRTLRNILTKTVTAPFRFLASLVGSDADLQTMGFAAGSDAIADETPGKLDSLAEALTQRPALKVLVRGSVNPRTDVAALREQTLRAELLATGLSESDIDSRSPAWEAAIVERFAALTGGAEEAADTEEADSAAPPIAEKEQAVLARIAVEPAALDALWRNRATAVKRYLVNDGGIEADRVTVSGRAEDATEAVAVLDVSA
jgi:hypothetical protein